MKVKHLIYTGVGIVGVGAAATVGFLAMRKAPAKPTTVTKLNKPKAAANPVTNVITSIAPALPALATTIAGFFGSGSAADATLDVSDDS